MSENSQPTPDPLQAPHTPPEHSLHSADELCNAFASISANPQPSRKPESEVADDSTPDEQADADRLQNPLLTLFHGDADDDPTNEISGDTADDPTNEISGDTAGRATTESLDTVADEIDDDLFDDEPAEDEPVDEESICPISPRSLFEAMLFVGDPENRPLPAGRAADLMRGVEPEEIPRLVNQLNADYARRGCPYRVVNQPGGYRIELEPNFESVRRRFYGKVREVRLSQAAIDVLATVSYRQPITSDEVATIRDYPSTAILNQLVRRGLLAIQRSPDRSVPPRYITTDRFLELFNLESIDFLPQTEDIDEN